jgi:uncharacterized membrane protein
MKQVLLAALAAVLVAVTVAAPVKADDQSFLNDRREEHQYHVPATADRDGA